MGKKRIFRGEWKGILRCTNRGKGCMIGKNRGEPGEKPGLDRGFTVGKTGINRGSAGVKPGSNRVESGG